MCAFRIADSEKSRGNVRDHDDMKVEGQTHFPSSTQALFYSSAVFPSKYCMHLLPYWSPASAHSVGNFVFRRELLSQQYNR